MALTNRQRVEKGLDLLRDGLAPYVERELATSFGKGWFDALPERRGMTKLPNGQVRWDTQALLKTMIEQWNDQFRQNLGPFERNLVHELVEHRNRWAHNENFTSDDTLRALDSIHRLLQAVSAAAQAKEVDEVRVELQRTVYAEQARQKTRSVSPVEIKTESGLKPWREIVQPHPDVSSGRYVQAEFAADLAQVSRGEGSEEYLNPVEFYRRTFITDGLRDLLTKALTRLSGNGSDPVVELQTNFGGGKTHGMLALYHLFAETPATNLPGLEPILKAVNMKKAPVARRAVLVGTALSPGQVSTKSDGTKVRTIWGEMAWQLGGRDGYQMVAASDAQGISPGSKDLADLFNALSPCLILIDEWVAYARQLVNKRDLPAGDFEAQASFAQALTEAAKAAKQTLVVASIPASKIEIGGENGEYALEALRNIFERLGTPWRPASADEGFEIVRRRLFEPISEKTSFAEKDAVIDAFAKMYRTSAAEFPSGCGEGTYRKKLEAAYPIHPEFFDRLYGEWSTLDKFQRTRGVLRLLAKVIHRLWENNDGGLLIMPSSVPMDDGAVKSELTRYLHDVWEPIISEDVDGPSSLPLDIDRNTPNLGRYSACRRVARTLYMGTAPGSEGRNPGLDDRSVRLGCAQPGETPATFGDALRRISERAKHVHQDGNRYWISTKANLNRVAEDRANELLRQPEVLHEQLKARLRDDHTRGEFKAVHACPESSSEVGDDAEARLVILGPQYGHRKGTADSAGMKAAKEILESRGNSPRINRNTLVFLAPDGQRMADLLAGVANFMAWRSIIEDEVQLDLSASQKRHAETKFRDGDKTVDLRIQETWVFALVPVQTTPTAEVVLDEIRVTGTDSLAKRTAAKLKADETLLPEMGGTRLRMELDRYLWTDKNHVSFAQLTEWFPRYLYLPRVVSRDTLERAVKDGIAQLLVDDTFAIAGAFDEPSGRYQGLMLRGTPTTVIGPSTLLVKPPVAKAQLDEDNKPKCPACKALEPDWQPVDRVCQKCGYGYKAPEKCPKCGATEPTWVAEETRCKGCGYKVKPPSIRPPSNHPPRKIKMFVGSVKLDDSRVGRDAGRVAEEVLSHLTTLRGAKAKVTLEIEVEVPDGIGDDVVRVVTENAATLKFDSASFEKE
jgi:hypothetical protein